MKAIDVQLTKTYILDVPAVPFADCTAAVTAIRAGKEAMCPQALGEFTRTRDVTELSCMSSNDSVKAAGKIAYGDFTLELLYDPADTAGQAMLTKAMDDNKPVIIAVESPNADTKVGTTGASGDIIWTVAMVTGDGIAYPDGSKVGYSVTLAPYGGFNRCPGVAGTK